jgi:hypothetical protein
MNEIKDLLVRYNGLSLLLRVEFYKDSAGLRKITSFTIIEITAVDSAEDFYDYLKKNGHLPHVLDILSRDSVLRTGVENVLNVRRLG